MKSVFKDENTTLCSLRRAVWEIIQERERKVIASQRRRLVRGLLNHFTRLVGGVWKPQNMGVGRGVRESLHQ